MNSDQVVNMSIQELNANNATHLLQCRHAFGDNGKFYNSVSFSGLSKYPHI